MKKIEIEFQLNKRIKEKMQRKETAADASNHKTERPC